MHDLLKVTLLKATATSSQYDIICLSETFLGSTIESDVKRLNVEGYILIIVDQPGNKKEKRHVCTIKAIYQLYEELIYIPCKNP